MNIEEIRKNAPDSNYYSYVLQVAMLGTKKGWFVFDKNGVKTPCSTPNANTLLSLKIKPL